MSRWDDHKQMLWEAAQEMAQAGLVGTSSGNASMRLPERDLIAITPSRVPYNRMKPTDIVVVDFAGEVIEGDLVPSTETLIHAAAYQSRSDVGAVLHTHSIFATVAAVAGLEIPPIMDEMVVYVGGAVRVAEYAFPGSPDLARNTTLALGERNAALLRNHGLLGVGSTLREALDVCELVERIAKVFVYTHIMGASHPLPPDIVEAEEELFRMRRAAEKRQEGSQ